MFVYSYDLKLKLFVELPTSWILLTKCFTGIYG